MNFLANGYGQLYTYITSNAEAICKGRYSWAHQIWNVLNRRGRMLKRYGSGMCSHMQLSAYRMQDWLHVRYNLTMRS